MNEPRKKEKNHTTILYAMLLLSIAACTVFLSLFLRTEQELRITKEQLDLIQAENYSLAEQQGKPQDSQRAFAAELLSLAQNACYKEDKVSFHAYMAMLEGYADELPAHSRELYEELLDKLS